MKSPAFQFYPADFLADENVVLMTNRELGCYIKLMCYCWREGSIPSDVSKIARLCGEDGLAMADLWIAISSCFDLAIDDPSRLIHLRLVSELEKQKEHAKERSTSGKKGAEARWGKGSKANSLAIAEPLAEPIANDGSSSSSSTSVKPSTNVEGEPPAKKPKAETGSRLSSDWVLPRDWGLWAVSQGMDEKAVRTTADTFRDHWVGKAGKDARKSDWLATWRNWVRRDLTNRGGRYGNAGNEKPRAGSRSIPDRVKDAIAKQHAERQTESFGATTGTTIEGEFDRLPF